MAAAAGGSGAGRGGTGRRTASRGGASLGSWDTEGTAATGAAAAFGALGGTAAFGGSGGGAGRPVSTVREKSCWRTLLISCWDSNGFVTKSLAPTCTARSRSNASKVPVSKMMGTAFSIGSARSAAQIS